MSEKKVHASDILVLKGFVIYMSKQNYSQYNLHLLT
jgi:hypothetical protein